jgi:hypothetical protein
VVCPRVLSLGLFRPRFLASGHVALAISVAFRGAAACPPLTPLTAGGGRPVLFILPRNGNFSSRHRRRGNAALSALGGFRRSGGQSFPARYHSCR